MFPCLKPSEASLLSKNSSLNKALMGWPCLPFWKHLPDYLMISRTGLQQASFLSASVMMQIFRVGGPPCCASPSFEDCFSTFKAKFKVSSYGSYSL